MTNTRGRGVRRAAALVLGAALVVASCGGDDDGDAADDTADTAAAATAAPTPTDAGDTADEGGGTATTAGGTAAGGDAVCGLGTGEAATGDPIKIGAVVGKTGPADFSSASLGAAAYFDCVNANGGINGRPIEYLVEDDGWDPEKAATVAKKLVEDEEVVGMVGSTSFVECAANAQYYADNGVAVIAGVGVPRECFFSSNIAPVNQGPRLSGIGAAEYAREQGAKKMACIANVIPNFGGWVCQGLEAWGEANGVEVTSFNGQPDGSDAETIVQQALAIEPDSITVVEAGPGVIGYLKVGEQQDADVNWYAPTSAYDVAFPAAVGDYWFGNLQAEIEFNMLDSTGPHNTLWQQVIDEFGDASAPRDSFSQGGFLSAMIAVDALLGLDPASIDRASVTEAFIGVDSFESDLVCGPWSFGEGEHHNANHAGRIVELAADGSWKLLKDCFEVPDPELADIVG
ncbi:MAG: ABC transporter substrate-binding protein [Acidimicrobiales bacterium]|nr:ABC transporter substrate-binding protein [Acidimicrobiales bacterium]MCB9395794.1 ABC transporter substrate-binding protein [Acidimicrobiaceae bacterium]